MEFKDLIKNIREQHQLTQEELAKKIFVTRQAISKWELGKSIPSLESLRMISNEFDIAMEELLGVVETKQQEKENWIPLARRSLYRIIMPLISDMVAVAIAIIGIMLALKNDQEATRLSSILTVSFICAFMFFSNTWVLVHSLFPLKKILLYYTSSEIKIETNKGSVIVPLHKIRGYSYSTVGTTQVGILSIDTTDRLYKIYSVAEVNKVKTILDEVRFFNRKQEK